MATKIIDPEAVTHAELFTHTPLIPDNTSRSSQWKVKTDVGIVQIIKSPMLGQDGQRFLLGTIVKTEFEWIFNERAAHRLKKSSVYDRDGLVTTGYYPVFVETPAVGYVQGNEVVGFVISGDCIAPVNVTDGSHKTWLQIPLPAVVATSTSAKSRLKTFPIANSKKNGFYDVVVYTDKTVSCPCKAWINRRECRHMRDTAVVSYINSLP